MFYHNINPVLLKIGFFEIRYYGLIFVLNFVIAYFLLKKLAKIREINLNKDDIADFLLYEIIGVVLGARIVYVAVYNFLFYAANPLEIFAVWHGGLSFHGGLLGGILAGWIFCRKKNIHFLDLADITVIPLSLGLMFGRIANFINGELVGRITSVPWAVKFPDYEGFRHPSQLYESAKNLIIFITLWSIKDKKFRRGNIFLTFLMMYSALRFFVEFFRESDVQLGYLFLGLTMGQILNVVMFLISLGFLAWLSKRKN